MCREGFHLTTLVSCRRLHLQGSDRHIFQPGKWLPTSEPTDLFKHLTNGRRYSPASASTIPVADMYLLASAL